MNLSKHFTREEFEESQTAERNGIDNTMPHMALQNAIDLCEHILEPVRLHFRKPVKITSGYRSPKLNKLAKGSKTSQHMTGEAADIKIRGVSNWDLLRFIHDKLPFDQLICEYMVRGNPDRGWVHVSYRHGNGRKDTRTIDRNGSRPGINFN